MLRPLAKNKTNATNLLSALQLRLRKSLESWEWQINPREAEQKIDELFGDLKQH